ncbi:MAG: 3-keto-disaccharide hydrolase [Flavisolibacter sp.]
MKLYFALLLLLSFSLSDCNSSKKSTNNNTTANTTQNGYTPLFDGLTMNGWRTYQNKSADSWMVQDGALHCKGGGGQRSDLITTGEYENFDLSLDWKISPQGNSGILYMVTEDYPASYLSGPEYQIIDDLHFPEQLEEWQKTGANYAMDAAPTAAPNAAGEWNHTRIVVNNGHVEHWLNGKKIVDYQLWTNEWKAKKQAGKWKDAEGYGKSKKGHIALQDHGSEAWFKNIQIKEL